MKVVGVMRAAGRNYAAISGHHMLSPERWLEVGDNFAECQVREIGPEWVVLNDLRWRRQIRLPLGGAGKIEGFDAARRRTDWINSDANPMYFAPFPVPSKLLDRWAKLSPQDQSQVVAGYRDFGWKLVGIDASAKKPQVIWQNIYEAERKAARDKLWVDFEASLDSEQQVTYARLRTKVSDTSGAPKAREQVLADNAARGEEWDKFNASLSPRQRGLYFAAVGPAAGMIRTK